MIGGNDDDDLDEGVTAAAVAVGGIKAGMFIMKIPAHNTKLPKKFGCWLIDHKPTLQYCPGFDFLKNHFCASAVVSISNPSKYIAPPTFVVNPALMVLPAFNPNRYGMAQKTFQKNVTAQNENAP